jgi:large subunit ribosomal protein L22
MVETITKVRAYAKGVEQAPRKVAIVASLVRRRSVEDALVILQHTPRRSALPVIKAIESARANATNNHGLDGKSLVISMISVTTGTRMKRYKPAGRGRAMPFEKKSANILVELSGDVKPKKQPVKKPAATKETK